MIQPQIVQKFWEAAKLLCHAKKKLMNSETANVIVLQIHKKNCKCSIPLLHNPTPKSNFPARARRRTKLCCQKISEPAARKSIGEHTQPLGSLNNHHGKQSISPLILYIFVQSVYTAVLLSLNSVCCISKYMNTLSLLPEIH